MHTPPAHRTRFTAQFAIAAHKFAHGREPRRVEVGLMEMRGLEDVCAQRIDGAPLIVEGVPVVVGSLVDRVKAVR